MNRQRTTWAAALLIVGALLALRLTNEELIRSKKEVRRLGGAVGNEEDKDDDADLDNLMKSM